MFKRGLTATMIADLDAQLTTVTCEVFQTMLNWTVSADAADGEEPPHSYEMDDVNGVIGFGGKISGTLCFSCSEGLAADISRTLLGQECSDAEIADVAGELTNMLAGACKSRLCDAGYAVAMSIPNVVRGEGIRATGMDAGFMVRRRFVTPSGLRFQVVALGRVS
jgi:chemotaxis protein CheX